jgi:hypothetical protein
MNSNKLNTKTNDYNKNIDNNLIEKQNSMNIYYENYNILNNVKDYRWEKIIKLKFSE